MPANRLIPINLRLPRNLITDSDRLAKREGSSRTELMRLALRSYIERRQKFQAIINVVEQRGRVAGINTPKDIEDALASTRTKLHGQ